MPDGKRLRPLHAPEAPHENQAFMQSTAARPIRILAEYIHPLAQLKKEGIGDTVVMFGSARIESHETAAARCTRLKDMNTRKMSKLKLKKHHVALRDAKSALEMSRYYEQARLLSHKLTTWALSLGPRPRRFVVCSGGGPGIMEAANRGAYEAGGKTIGMNILLPFEQRPNRYITPSLNLEFHYFFMRKLWFAYLAKALVVFPGGFGTLDEMFEILTLVQTQKMTKKITVVIYGPEYWKKVFNLEVLVDMGAISPKDLDLFQYADSPEQAFEMLRKGLTENYLIAEAAAAARAGHKKTGNDDDLMAGWSVDDFLGPELAKTRK